MFPYNKCFLIIHVSFFLHFFQVPKSCTIFERGGFGESLENVLCKAPTTHYCKGLSKTCV